MQVRFCILDPLSLLQLSGELPVRMDHLINWSSSIRCNVSQTFDRFLNLLLDPNLLEKWRSFLRLGRFSVMSNTNFGSLFELLTQILVIRSNVGISIDYLLSSSAKLDQTRANIIPYIESIEAASVSSVNNLHFHVRDRKFFHIIIRITRLFG